MDREKLFKLYVGVIAACGLVTFTYAVVNLDVSVLSTTTVILMVVALFVTSRLTLSLPHSNSYLSFADTMIFFAFIRYGGELAIIFATLEVSISCIFLKYGGFHLRKLAIPFTVSTTAFCSRIT